MLHFFDKVKSGWVVSSMPMKKKDDAYNMFREGNYPEDIYRVECEDGYWYITSKPV